MAIFKNSLQINRPPFLGGGSWDLQNLNDITIIFGKNGSGKSKLLQLLRDSDNNLFHYIPPERGGNISQRADLAQEQLTGRGRVTRRQGNFAELFKDQAISRIQSLFIKVGGKLFDGGVTELKKVEIVNLFQTLLPDFAIDINGNLVNKPFTINRLSSGSPIKNIGELSSGEGEVITLAVDILTVCSIWKTDQQEGILLIDEPDTHLHPDFQQNLAHFLCLIRDKFNVQIIVATHSTTLLSALGHYGKDQTSIIYLNNTVTQQNAVKFDESLQELATCLGGHALMGPLFGAPILLVEGDDEYKIWGQIPRYGKVRLAVIPCYGADKVKSYQKTLEKIFDNLRTTHSPVGFALLDGDVSKPRIDKHNQQKHIKYLQLNCKASENLYLSDKVLELLGTDWASAIIKLKAEKEAWGKDIAEKLDKCDSWDIRNTPEIKKVINALIGILDKTKRPWYLRVAEVIGKQKPTGQLADFLGEDIVSAVCPKDD